MQDTRLKWNWTMTYWDKTVYHIMICILQCILNEWKWRPLVGRSAAYHSSSWCWMRRRHRPPPLVCCWWTGRQWGTGLAGAPGPRCRNQTEPWWHWGSPGPLSLPSPVPAPCSTCQHIYKVNVGWLGWCLTFIICVKCNDEVVYDINQHTWTASLDCCLSSWS